MDRVVRDVSAFPAFLLVQSGSWRFEAPLRCPLAAGAPLSETPGASREGRRTMSRMRNTNDQTPSRRIRRIVTAPVVTRAATLVDDCLLLRVLLSVGVGLLAVGGGSHAAVDADSRSHDRCGLSRARARAVPSPPPSGVARGPRRSGRPLLAIAIARTLALPPALTAGFLVLGTAMPGLVTPTMTEPGGATPRSVRTTPSSVRKGDRIQGFAGRGRAMMLCERAIISVTTAIRRGSGHLKWFG